jgi:hypothetical protein
MMQRDPRGQTGLPSRLEHAPVPVDGLTVDGARFGFDTSPLDGDADGIGAERAQQRAERIESFLPLEFEKAEWRAVLGVRAQSRRELTSPAPAKVYQRIRQTPSTST